MRTLVADILLLALVTCYCLTQVLTQLRTAARAATAGWRRRRRRQQWQQQQQQMQQHHYSSCCCCCHDGSQQHTVNSCIAKSDSGASKPSCDTCCDSGTCCCCCDSSCCDTCGCSDNSKAGIELHKDPALLSRPQTSQSYSGSDWDDESDYNDSFQDSDSEAGSDEDETRISPGTYLGGTKNAHVLYRWGYVSRLADLYYESYDNVKDMMRYIHILKLYAWSYIPERYIWGTQEDFEADYSDTEEVDSIDSDGAAAAGSSEPTDGKGDNVIKPGIGTGWLKINSVAIFASKHRSLPQPASDAVDTSSNETEATATDEPPQQPALPSQDNSNKQEPPPARPKQRVVKSNAAAAKPRQWGQHLPRAQFQHKHPGARQPKLKAHQDPGSVAVTYGNVRKPGESKHKSSAGSRIVTGTALGEGVESDPYAALYGSASSKHYADLITGAGAGAGAQQEAAGGAAILPNGCGGMTEGEKAGTGFHQNVYKSLEVPAAVNSCIDDTRSTGAATTTSTSSTIPKNSDHIQAPKHDTARQRRREERARRRATLWVAAYEVLLLVVMSMALLVHFWYATRVMRAGSFDRR